MACDGHNAGDQLAESVKADKVTWLKANNNYKYIKAWHKRWEILIGVDHVGCYRVILNKWEKSSVYDKLLSYNYLLSCWLLNNIRYFKIENIFLIISLGSARPKQNFKTK